MKLEFIRHIFEKYQISNFMKIPLLGAELFHAGGRAGRLLGRETGRHEANTRFLQFCRSA
jgi:hypothetical protein